MFHELPKLFDRNFAMGYFLPTAVFIVANVGLCVGFGLFDVQSIARIDILIDATLIGFISWLSGTILLALNLPIIRFMEGYGKLNPLHIFIGIERRRFKKLLGQIIKTDENIEKCNDEWPREKCLDRYSELKKKIVEQFPDREGLILPTGFGNIIRSFEVYSRVMYGFEAIEGWDRLIAVIPKDYIEIVNSTKAKMDFWVNIGFLSIILIIEYVSIVICLKDYKLYWFPLCFLGLASGAYWAAKASAIEWGTTIKAAIDLFLPDLRLKLRLSPPITRAQERSLWTQFSQSIYYRLPDSLPDQDKPP